WVRPVVGAAGLTHAWGILRRLPLPVAVEGAGFVPPGAQRHEQERLGALAELLLVEVDDGAALEDGADDAGGDRDDRGLWDRGPFEEGADGAGGSDGGALTLVAGGVVPGGGDAGSAPVDEPADSGDDGV